MEARAGAGEAGPWRASRRWLVLLAVIVVLCGGALLLYHRPWGGRAWAGTHPGRVGLHVALTSVLRALHVLAAYAGVMAAAGVALLRWWRRSRPRDQGQMQAGLSSTCLATALLVGVLALASGHAFPWEQTLPWSDRPVLQPAQLDDTEGPFPELVGVAASYQDNGADPSGRTRMVAAVAIFHIVVPLLGALFMIRSCSGRRRSSVSPSG